MTIYTGHLLYIYQHTIKEHVTQTGSAITFSYLATVLYLVRTYGIEQLSTFKHRAGSITITHSVHKFLNLSFIHIYFPYHNCLE